jgi:hypothetical protein
MILLVLDNTFTTRYTPTQKLHLTNRIKEQRCIFAYPIIPIITERRVILNEETQKTSRIFAAQN